MAYGTLSAHFLWAKIESQKAIQHLMSFTIILQLILIIDCMVTPVVIEMFAPNSISIHPNEMMNRSIDMAQGASNGFERFRPFLGNIIANRTRIERSALAQPLRPNSHSENSSGRRLTGSSLRNARGSRSKWPKDCVLLRASDCVQWSNNSIRENPAPAFLAQTRKIESSVQKNDLDRPKSTTIVALLPLQSQIPWQRWMKHVVCNLGSCNQWFLRVWIRAISVLAKGCIVKKVSHCLRFWQQILDKTDQFTWNLQTFAVY
jgi:hypothetical protein